MWRRVRLKLIYVTDMIGMDRYAKLVDGNIFYAPRCKGNVSNYDCSVELMSADGFLPVVESEMPVCKEGEYAVAIYAVVHYKIVQSWEIKVVPVERLVL